MKKILIFKLSMVCCALLSAALPVCAQKQFLSAWRALDVKRGGYALSSSFWKETKPLKITAPLKYVPPVHVDMNRLEELSSSVNRVVLLNRKKEGTLRELSELEAFMMGNASKALRSQAAHLLAVGFTPSEARLFLDWYPFLTTNTRFSQQNNDWLIRVAPLFKKQAVFIQEHRKEILSALKITEMDRPGLLVRSIRPETRLIMLGEVHGRNNLRAEMVSLLTEYRKKYPNRKMIIFSEFLPNFHPQFWKIGQAVPKDFFEKNPAFSAGIYQIANQLDMDIYGLEDLNFTYLQTLKMSGLDFTIANTSFRVMPVRNKYWESIIRSVMARTRQKYPDAVFFVHAGNMHINKSVLESLASMMKDENPFCIEFKNGFQSGLLGFLLNKNPLLMAEVTEPYLLSWKENNDFSRVLGFDAQVLLPFEKERKVPFSGE